MHAVAVIPAARSCRVRCGESPGERRSGSGTPPGQSPGPLARFRRESRFHTSQPARDVNHSSAPRLGVTRDFIPGNIVGLTSLPGGTGNPPQALQQIRRCLPFLGLHFAAVLKLIPPVRIDFPQRPKCVAIGSARCGCRSGREFVVVAGGTNDWGLLVCGGPLHQAHQERRRSQSARRRKRPAFEEHTGDLYRHVLVQPFVDARCQSGRVDDDGLRAAGGPQPALPIAFHANLVPGRRYPIGSFDRSLQRDDLSAMRVGLVEELSIPDHGRGLVRQIRERRPCDLPDDLKPHLIFRCPKRGIVLHPSQLYLAQGDRRRALAVCSVFARFEFVSRGGNFSPGRRIGSHWGQRIGPFLPDACRTVCRCAQGTTPPDEEQAPTGGGDQSAQSRRQEESGPDRGTSVCLLVQASGAFRDSPAELHGSIST